MTELSVGGRIIDITSPERLVFPEAGLSKADLLVFHERIASRMIPHLAGRPLAMKRFPEGIGDEGFFQKRAPLHLPDWVERVDVPTRGGDVIAHVVVSEPAALLELVQFGVVELHPWLSRADDLERPDRLVFDLDPEEGDVEGARLGARTVRDVLNEELLLDSRVMTSGSKGFHVVAQIEPTETFDVIRELVADLAAIVADRHPDRLTVAHRIADREGRVYIDHLRNTYGQTSVVPYGVRARPYAPVATPLDWDELGSVEPTDYRIDNIFRRLGQREDPWFDARVVRLPDLSDRHG